jgi:hypothetical protein
MKVVRLPALHISRLYPAGNIPGTHFCYRLSQSEGHGAAERIVTPTEIQPATPRLVAQCLNQLRHRVLLWLGKRTCDTGALLTHISLCLASA